MSVRFPPEISLLVKAYQEANDGIAEFDESRRRAMTNLERRYLRIGNARALKYHRTMNALYDALRERGLAPSVENPTSIQKENAIRQYIAGPEPRQTTALERNVRSHAEQPAGWWFGHCPEWHETDGDDPDSPEPYSCGCAPWHIDEDGADTRHEIYDLTYTIRQGHGVVGVEVTITVGGPRVWLDTRRGMVCGSWGLEKVEIPAAPGIADAVQSHHAGNSPFVERS